MLFSAFLFGLLGSLHCIGMCGPIAFMLPVDRLNKVKQFLQVLSYHVGRILSYSIIGLLFGLLGKGFNFFGFQQYVSIIVGVIMILTVLIPTVIKKLPVSKLVTNLVLKVKSSLGKELVKKGNDTFFTLGFLNGLLPCGLVYMAVFGAITMTSALEGALYMTLFGVGTIPLMTAVIYVKNFAKGKLRKKAQRIIPVFVVMVGLLFILRGLGLGIPYISPQKGVSNLSTQVEGCN